TKTSARTDGVVSLERDMDPRLNLEEDGTPAGPRAIRSSAGYARARASASPGVRGKMPQADASPEREPREELILEARERRHRPTLGVALAEHQPQDGRRLPRVEDEHAARLDDQHGQGILRIVPLLALPRDARDFLSPELPPGHLAAHVLEPAG